MALLLIATLLATATLKPAPARALDAGETVGVIFGAIAAYVVIIFIATAAVYHQKKHPPQRAPVSEFRDAAPTAPDGLGVGTDCPGTSGAMPLACW